MAHTVLSLMTVYINYSTLQHQQDVLDAIAALRTETETE